MATAALEQEISRICVACGMCCDGTLFGKALILDDSDRALWETLGLSTLAENDKLWFSLPCHHFICKCSIYDHNRPNVCSSYFCSPIRKLKSDEMPLQEAEEIISRAVRLKQQFDSALEDFPEFSGKSIHRVRRLLSLHKLSPDEQVNMKRQYAMLYLIGIKLFPLLTQISQSKKRESK